MISRAVYAHVFSVQQLKENVYTFLNSSVEDFGAVDKRKVARSQADYYCFYLEILGNNKIGDARVNTRKIVYIVSTLGLQKTLKDMAKSQGNFHFCVIFFFKMSFETLFQYGGDGRQKKNALQT